MSVLDVQKLYQRKMEECKYTIMEIAEASGISTERVHKILHEDLSERWVPRLFTIDQTRVRVDMSREIQLFQKNLTSFLRRLIIVDET